MYVAVCLKSSVESNFAIRKGAANFFFNSKRDFGKCFPLGLKTFKSKGSLTSINYELPIADAAKEPEVTE